MRSEWVSEWVWWRNFKNLHACGYHVPLPPSPPSVETGFFPYFLINSRWNCWATISMLLSREIRIHTYTYHSYISRIVLLLGSIAIHPSITRLLLILLLLLSTYFNHCFIYNNELRYFRSLLLPYLLCWLVYNNVVSNSRLINICFFWQMAIIMLLWCFSKRKTRKVQVSVGCSKYASKAFCFFWIWPFKERSRAS